MNAPPPDPSSQPSLSDDLRDVLKRAEGGDLDALPQLRQLLDDRPDLWQSAGDLAARAESVWIDLVAGSDLVVAESVRRKLDAMRKEIVGPSPTPLETLLTQQITASWLRVQYYTLLGAPSATRNLTIAQNKHFQECLGRAQRKHQAAVKSLAQVQALLAPRFTKQSSSLQDSTVSHWQVNHGGSNLRTMAMPLSDMQPIGS